MRPYCDCDGAASAQDISNKPKNNYVVANPIRGVHSDCMYKLPNKHKCFQFVSIGRAHCCLYSGTSSLK
ncbi:hypothetical protein PHET_01769 [Paragonimus heterotremus]|uniref:Uncharacterized protein n=1 Tax=Paragonimus heterotremus TaxID=100268 RepID=A0A8J4WUD5_9TREM|nr:hypothetical protein PHET_01769 [Paragonimus heterotremus]